MDHALTIEVRHEQGYTIVTVAGEIDISTVTRLRNALFEMAASSAPLVIDLNQVSFIDSVRARRASRHGESRCRARQYPTSSLRPAQDPPACAPDRARPPDTVDLHPRRGAGSARTTTSLTSGLGAGRSPVPATTLRYDNARVYDSPEACGSARSTAPSP